VLSIGAATPIGGWLSVALFHLALALLLVALTFELVLFLVPPGAPGRLAGAISAGLILALVPHAVESTKLGEIDHHVVEALILLGLARWAFLADPAAEGSLRRRAAFEVAGAALCGGAVLSFSGSPLYVALVLPLLAGPIFSAARPKLVGSGAPALLVGALLAAAGTAPMVAAHGRPLAFGFPSWLQPILLGLAGSGLVLAVLCGRIVSERAGGRRLVLLVLLASGALAAVLLAAPELGRQGLAGLRGWLLHEDPWLAQVDEFQPMWHGRLTATAATVDRYLGLPGLLLPLALPFAAASLARTGWRRSLGTAWLALSICGLALIQVRFCRVAAPFIGVALALALAYFAARLGSRLGPGSRLAAGLPLVATLALAAVDPKLVVRLTHPVEVKPNEAVELALDLRHWPIDPAAPGVLAPWDLGNHVLVLAGRPVVADGFGSYPCALAFEDSERAYRVAEPELLAMARARRVGVVVAGAANLFGRVRGPGSGTIPFSGRGFNADWLRAVPSAPLLVGGSGVPALGLKHDEHLMPRFASTQAVVGIDHPPPVLWGYEIVPGARLEGTAGKGEPVVLEVPLEEHGRTHTWRALAVAGPDGRWSLTVPLPTNLATSTVRTAEGRLRLGQGPARPQEVPEEAIRAGRIIAVGPGPG
jgi:Archaeal glycosylation protein B long peripheral domain